MRSRLSDFIHFGRRLAASPPGAIDAYAIGRDLGVPTSTLGDWLRQLRFQRALVPGSQGETVDIPRLYAYYTAHRICRLDPIAEINTDMSAHELDPFLDQHGIRHALGMISAANAWAFYEDRRDIQMYVNRRDVPRIRDLLPSGPNRFQLFAERLDDLPTARRGTLVTDAFLTLIDCRAHPEGGAHADFLDRNVIRRGRK